MKEPQRIDSTNEAYIFFPLCEKKHSHTLQFSISESALSCRATARLISVSFFLKWVIQSYRTAHWGLSQPQLFGASIRGGFFESLKHAKQDLSIIEFENQVWNSLHKLVVWKGELILIFGSKIHNFWTIFYRRTKISLKIQPEIQKFGF